MDYSFTKVGVDGPVSRAMKVVTALTDSLNTPYQGSSSMTHSVYDTAWVAMVSKENIDDHGNKTWNFVFPKCFQFLLENQREDGGFGEHGSAVDGILNTMAAVLALCKYSDKCAVGNQIPITGEALKDRIARGKAYLNEVLAGWDVQSTIHVGFEILIPKLLDFLEQEGFELEFQGRNTLMALNSRKLNGIKPSVFYTPRKTTLLHSLEAFIGHVDMNKIRHHLVNGSMMGSPSSTAAYLENLEGWDDEAEEYLHFVVDNGTGGVPSACPISIFETTWILTTFLEAGLRLDQLGPQSVWKLADFLKSNLDDNGGVVGFAPGVLADGDDTAKAILSLRLLGQDASCENMIELFESEHRFKTYEFESSESFSVNCNVLIALLSSTTPSTYLPQIRKALDFLCRRWFKGSWSDKWNLEPQYCMMLLSQALMRTVDLWGVGSDDALSQGLEEYVNDRIPLITIQILIRTLGSQKDEGGWKGCPETTAYAVLTLKRLLNLPWYASTGLDRYIRDGICAGMEFLQKSAVIPASIWVEKVTYGSRLLSETYCVAALASTHDLPGTRKSILDEKLRHLLGDILPTRKKLELFVCFFSRLPIFSQEPQWRLCASIVEGYLLAPRNRKYLHELDIFPHERLQKTGSSGEGYLEYIPLTWTTCNNAGSFGISTEILVEMLCISTLNFQVDKYLEQVTGDERVVSAGKLGFESMKSIIRGLCREPQLMNGPRSRPAPDAELELLFSEVSRTLSRFVQFIHNHPSVSSASSVVRRRLLHQLSVFLEAHVTQGYDNAHMRVCRQGIKNAQVHVFSGAPDSYQTYYEWVHTTSADHTSCPYSFELFTCLISTSPGDGDECLRPNDYGQDDCFSSSPLTRYLSSDVCRHLATLCRQYNDYGSVRRDSAEGNLNSIDFPEFHRECSHVGEYNVDAQEKADSSCRKVDESRGLGADPEMMNHRRAELMKVADYERQCLDLALGQLKHLLDQRTNLALQVFVDVTDLYGQIYVVRDINTDD